MAGLDVKRVSAAQWLGVGAGLLAFVASFMTWKSVDTDFSDIEGKPGASMMAMAAGLLEGESGVAWESLPAVLAVLLLVAAGAVAILPLLGVRVPAPKTLWLGLAGGALVLVVVDWLTLPGVRGVMEDLMVRFGAPEARITDQDVAEAEKMLGVGPGIGLYLGLAAAVISIVGAVLYRNAQQADTPPATPPLAA